MTRSTYHGLGPGHYRFPARLTNIAQKKINKNYLTLFIRGVPHMLVHNICKIKLNKAYKYKNILQKRCQYALIKYNRCKKQITQFLEPGNRQKKISIPVTMHAHTMREWNACTT